jgi:hypothetical protein
MRRDTTIEDTLRSIENRVMGDVWLGATRRHGGRMLAIALGFTAVAGWFDADRGVHKVALVACTLFATTAMISLVALQRRRFAWSCAAVYAGAVATVAGLGAFWWYRTAHVDPMPLTTLLGSVISAALTVGWLTVVTTPLGRSQPDMRSA